MRKFTNILVVGLALLFCQIAVQAQTGGSISGTVTDPNKAVVAGASIIISNDATKQQFAAVSNDEGFFRIPNVSAGVYTATVTGKGFKTSIVKLIKVDVGSASSINVSMEIGGAAEQVTVVGGGELLKTDSATIGTTLTGRQIRYSYSLTQRIGFGASLTRHVNSWTPPAIVRQRTSQGSTEYNARWNECPGQPAQIE